MDSVQPSVVKLAPLCVEKPWGRTSIPLIFSNSGGRRIGEVQFATPNESRLPLLVKYIFTSEPLSIQVHPSHDQASVARASHGKTECWYILDAEEGAAVGLGLVAELSQEVVRASALNGTIGELLRWTEVKQGDFFYVPAGTIHAVGAGVSLLEIQQNLEVTYRLYDYGRGRDLHLEDALSVAQTGPYMERVRNTLEGLDDPMLVDGPHFTLMYLQDIKQMPPQLSERQRWIIPIQGKVISGNHSAVPGECLLMGSGAPFTLSKNGVAIVGAAGSVNRGETGPSEKNESSRCR
jgi:mannose-6-phosphate isomerase